MCKCKCSETKNDTPKNSSPKEKPPAWDTSNFRIVIKDGRMYVLDKYGNPV